MNVARIAIMSVLFSAPALAQLAPPPGPVTETDRVREEADARVPIAAGFTTITEPGSYYLTQNISSLVVAAIIVDAPDVTIDLNGYAIQGGNGGINVNADRVKIRNGRITDTQGGAIAGRTASHLVVEDVTIQNCGKGTVLFPSSDPGIELSSGRVERVRIIDCPSGIGFFNDDATIKDTVIEQTETFGISFRGAANYVVFVENATLRDIGGIGIDATDHARIRNTTIDTTGAAGIDVQSQGLIENVTVINAGGDGIAAGRNGRVIASSAIDVAETGIEVGRGGLVRNSTVGGAGQLGIDVGDGGLVEGCTVNGRASNGAISTDIGIELAQGATARANAVFNYQGAGISMDTDAVADSNTISGNQTSSSDNGILAVGAFIQVTRNNISNSGSTGATLGATGSWLRTSVANLVTNATIGPPNDLDSPWTNFVD